MSTFLGLGKRFVEPYYAKTGNGVFLHIRRWRKEVCFAFTSFSLIVNDLVPKGAQEKRTEVLENKVDRM